MSPRPCPVVALICVILSICLAPGPALAVDPYDELWVHRLDYLDHEAALTGLDSERSGSLWLGVQGKLAVRPEGREVGAMMVLGVPLERSLLAQRDQPEAAEVEPDEDGARVEGEEDGRSSAQLSTWGVPALQILVTPADARAAVVAALEAAGANLAEARVDGLQGRSKSSALLPEVRLRVTRLVDEDQRLSPTEYDPERTTASGGTSLWLEGRLMWRLDRLVFASEEVALERLRIGHDRNRERIAMLVVELLGRWQRARVRELDDLLQADERTEAALDALEAELALDVLTDGWFSRWQGRPDEER